MSAIDQLDSALRSAQHLLGALGPKPKGDVQGMKDLARAIEREAHGVGTEATSALAVNRDVVFVGPGRAGFDGNTVAVAGVLRGAQGDLQEAANRVKTEAGRIDRDQKQWARDRHRLQGQIADLGAQIRNAAS